MHLIVLGLPHFQANVHICRFFQLKNQIECAIFILLCSGYNSSSMYFFPRGQLDFYKIFTMILLRFLLPIWCELTCQGWITITYLTWYPGGLETTNILVHTDTIELICQTTQNLKQLDFKNCFLRDQEVWGVWPGLVTARKMKIQSAALTLMNQGFLSNFLGWVCCFRACHTYSLLAACAKTP